MAPEAVSTVLVYIWLILMAAIEISFSIDNRRRWGKPKGFTLDTHLISTKELLEIEPGDQVSVRKLGTNIRLDGVVTRTTGSNIYVNVQDHREVRFNRTYGHSSFPKKDGQWGIEPKVIK